MATKTRTRPSVAKASAKAKPATKGAKLAAKATKPAARSAKPAEKALPGTSARAPAAPGRPAPSPPRPAPSEPTPPARPIRRREAAGRPDPDYIADLLAKSGRTSAGREDRAFLERPSSDDPLAEERGEDFIQSATSGEDADEQVLDPDEPAPEESSFVITTGKEEFGREPDESNPEDAEVAPFPTVHSES